MVAVWFRFNKPFVFNPTVVYVWCVASDPVTITVPPPLNPGDCGFFKNDTRATVYRTLFWFLFAIGHGGGWKLGGGAGASGGPPVSVARGGVRRTQALSPRGPRNHAHIRGHVEITFLFGLDIHDIKVVGGQRDDLPVVGDEDVVSAAAGPGPGEREAHSSASVSSNARRLLRWMAL